MGWLVALPAFAALYVINKRVNPRGKSKKAVAVITMTVAVAAGCGLAYTFAGGWVAWLVGVITPDANRWLAAAIPLALTVLVVGTAVADIAFDKKADKAAQICAVLMPTLLYLVVGGAMGETGRDAVTKVNTEMASFWFDTGRSW